MCELAGLDRPEPGAQFVRLNGAGGDGGVECFWTLPDGSEHGWQAKYWTDADSVDKSQIDESVATALRVHPKLTRYTIAIPLDPPGPTGRKTRGPGRPPQPFLDKVENWRTAWKQQAHAKGMQVEFRFAWATELASRLQAADTTGVRTLYWFSAEVLPERWWSERLEEATAAARPRYVPALAVEVSANLAFAAVCGDPAWRAELEMACEAVHEAADSLETGASDSATAAPPPLQDAASEAEKSAYEYRDAPSQQTRSVLRTAIAQALRLADEHEQREVGALDQDFPGGWDTAGWRQYQAELMVRLPAGYLDAVRSLTLHLASLEALVDAPLGQLPGARAVLLTGAAGSGKTFAACDYVARRLETGDLGVLAHGRWFSDGEPLLQLRDRLQLPADLTGQQALELLDQAGRSSGAPVLLVIDALNETTPRRMWRSHLERLVTAVERLEYLRLILTVRTHYRDEVVPDGMDLPSFEHRGFGSATFDAITEYADYYKLQPPTSPPISGDLSNPLYLRLLCEALEGSGSNVLDQSGMGLPGIAELLRNTKNQRISERLDAPVRDRIVHGAISEICDALGSDGTPWLTRPRARSITTAIWPDQTAQGSLLEALVAEGLLAEDVVDVGGRPTDVITMAFEAFGHYLLIDKLLAGIESIDALRTALASGPLHDLLGVGSRLDPGLLMALSVAVSDRLGTELTAVDDLLNNATAVTRATLAGLGWRATASVTTQTTALVEAALGSDTRTMSAALEQLFQLAPQPDHPLDARFLHRVLGQSGLARRDAMLIPWMHATHGADGAIDRLIGWARGKHLGGLGAATCCNWVTALLWCTGSADRRVRDGATLAAVRLALLHPDQLPRIIESFLALDDDWIVERALYVAYAVLLRGAEDTVWSATATQVHRQIFSTDVHPNAVIRDTARSILLAAERRGLLPTAITAESFTPPHPSAWPIGIPTVQGISAFDDERQYPRLVYSCTVDDFHTYVISPRLRDRDDVAADELGLRVVQDVVALGYDPHLHADYDRHVLNEYGGGRGRPKYIERIGKKYQWIAWSRLAGQLADHEPVTDPANQTQPPGPQGRALHTLDPTVSEPDTSANQPRPQVPDAPAASSEQTDADWLSSTTVSDIATAEANVDGRRHLVLAGDYTLDVPGSAARIFRHTWARITTRLVRHEDVATWISALENRDLAGSDLVRLPTLAEGFVGEYPFGLGHLEDLREYEADALLPTRTASGAVPASKPGAVNLLGEYEAALPPFDQISLDAPAPGFFTSGLGDLTWDGVASWRENDLIVAHAPRNSDGRRLQLTIDLDWTQRWQTDTGLAIVWIETGGKHLIARGPGRSPRGRMLWSQLAVLRSGTLEHTARHIVQQ